MHLHVHFVLHTENCSCTCTHHWRCSMRLSSALCTHASRYATSSSLSLAHILYVLLSNPLSGASLFTFVTVQTFRSTAVLSLHVDECLCMRTSCTATKPSILWRGRQLWEKCFVVNCFLPLYMVVWYCMKLIPLPSVQKSPHCIHLYHMYENLGRGQVIKVCYILWYLFEWFMRGHSLQQLKIMFGKPPKCIPWGSELLLWTITLWQVMSFQCMKHRGDMGRLYVNLSK